ncbi:hypothetical protein MLD38_008925 [Melastoma candidum]|uniref:Uncharacterized protein n=1 Tax=Melastoma candidum TaxID=119954 RepID=A0ACB9RZM2_9MYRT|nr:hypothetical protein MLD38_008925 [Melastoma candidum]
MGRYSGLFAMYATFASRDVDCCLIPESPFYLEGKSGLFEFVEQRLKEKWTCCHSSRRRSRTRVCCGEHAWWH